MVALASETAGSVQMAPDLSPRSLLIVHGTRDKVLPASDSRQIFDAARQRCGHGLSLAREELLELSLEWIPEQLDRPAR